MIELTQTSYTVLGLVSLTTDGATPYDLKQMVAISVGNFWSVPHSQLYAEPDRLAAAGYLSVTREKGGRRRKHYKLTSKGRKALDEWVHSPTEGSIELRDPGILKLFFGADPATLAAGQIEHHRRRLNEYEATRKFADELPSPGPRLALEAGIGHEREYVRFWSKLAKKG